MTMSMGLAPSFAIRLTMIPRFLLLCPTCRAPADPFGRWIPSGGSAFLCQNGHACSVPIKVANPEVQPTIGSGVGLPFDLT
jgi:hypothetical protein